MRRRVGKPRAVIVWASMCAALAFAPRQTGPAPTGAAAAITSASEVVLDGGAFQSETFLLSTVTGDWKVMNGAADVELELKGMHDGSAASLALEWHGATAQTITAATSRATGNDRASFVFALTGNPSNPLMAAPKDTDSVSVTVVNLEPNDLQASLAGSITSSTYDERAHVYPTFVVTGRIDLHRALAVGVMSSPAGRMARVQGRARHIIPSDI